MMHVIIKYESSWRNSFLDGNNNSVLPKNGRSFIGSITQLKKANNFKEQKITLDTVMGILNRLVGDQRKLYQSRERKFSKDYIFEGIEERVSFEDKPILSNEMIYLRNLTGSTDQNAFSGMLRNGDPWFSSDYSQELWGVMELSFEELCAFIIGEPVSLGCHNLDPLFVCNLLELKSKEKLMPDEGVVKAARLILEEKYSATYLHKTKENLVLTGSMYYSALYLQLERLEKKYDLSSAKSKSGKIEGVSKNNFTKKDFMKRLTTGNGKKIFGNPYLKKGINGNDRSILTKASGELVITIDIDQDKGSEIKQLIENAAVSSFYLGKKGLAYVFKIRL